MSDPATPDTSAPEAAPPPGFGLPGEALRGAALPPGARLPEDVLASAAPLAGSGPDVQGPPSSRGRAALAIGAFALAGVVVIGLVVTLLLTDDPPRPSREEQRESVASSLDAGGDEADRVAGERPFTAAEITACRADLRTYETAIASFVALESTTPTDELDLVTAGYLDVTSDLADLEVVDGVATAVVQPGAPCAGS